MSKFRDIMISQQGETEDEYFKNGSHEFTAGSVVIKDNNVTIINNNGSMFVDLTNLDNNSTNMGAVTNVTSDRERIIIAPSTKFHLEIAVKNAPSGTCSFYTDPSSGDIFNGNLSSYIGSTIVSTTKTIGTEIYAIGMWSGTKGTFDFNIKLVFE